MMNVVYSGKNIEISEVKSMYRINDAYTVIDKSYGSSEDIEEMLLGESLFEERDKEKKYFLYLPELFLNEQALLLCVTNLEGFVFTGKEEVLSLFPFSKIHKNQDIKKANDDKEIYVLTSFLERRDKKNAWLTFKKLKRDGYENSDILRVLRWWFKNMTIIKNHGKTNGFINTFTESKMINACTLYTKEELQNLYGEILSLYTKEALSKDTDNTIESFMLSL